MAGRLWRDGALRSTSVTVVRLGTLLGILEALAADWWSFLADRGTGRYGEFADQLQTLGALDLNGDILQCVAGGLRALHLQGVFWSDWNTKARIEEHLPKLFPVSRPPHLLAPILD